jgi:hypothetical protein
MRGMVLQKWRKQMTVMILQPLMLIHSLRKIPLSSAFGKRVRDDTLTNTLVGVILGEPGHSSER